MNIASRLSRVAEQYADQIAIASPLGKYQPGIRRPYRTQTFAELEEETNCIAAGLQRCGLRPGMRIVLLVRFGADFISLVFALLKAGAVIVLVDPVWGERT